MRIGIPKEIKRHEYRVGAMPSDVATFILAGHTVTVEAAAGAGAGFTDQEYMQAGARIAVTAAEVYAESDMVMKVKEPLPQEYAYFRPGLTIYGYLHLAAEPHLAKALMDTCVTAIAFETIQTANGALPCLAPMSEIAGRLSIQEGAKYLERPFGGRGVLLGGVPGVAKARVGILGGGTVGTNAAKIAVGMGAHVSILDISHPRLVYLDDTFGGRIETLFATQENISRMVETCDLLVGAVLIPGATAPRLVKRDDLARMKSGAVIVDVAVDQGGCVETTHPTTHDEPTFIVDEVVHYCVANMPAAVARTSTRALAYQTMTFGLELANKGIARAIAENPALRLGVNVHNGSIAHRAVAESLKLPHKAA